MKRSDPDAFQPHPASAGRIILVATPIGNLEDISPRAARVLRESDLIAAEDTRVARQLLTHLGFEKPLLSCFDANETERAGRIVDLCLDGKNVALITTRGHPAVSDPGYRVVKAAAEAGLTVSVVPGPCAAVSALALSGLPSDVFTFHGFPPRKGAARKALLKRIAAGGTHVLYESPNRIRATLGDLRDAAGDPLVCLCRELTKIHEEVFRGPTSEVLARIEPREVLGEITLVVHQPPPAEAPGLEEATAEFLQKALELKAALNLSNRDAATAVSILLGVPRKPIYEALSRAKGS